MAHSSKDVSNKESKDTLRITWNRQALESGGLDAVICALPAHVLMFCGYCPVIGNSIVIATPQKTVLLAPEDESELAGEGWADEVRTFETGSLEKLTTLTEVVRPLLKDVLQDLKIQNGRIGYENGPWVQPSPYVAMMNYGPALPEMIEECQPRVKLSDADSLLKRLRLIHTPMEIAQFRGACEVAARAFAEGVKQLRPGQTETQVAGNVERGLLQSSEDLRISGRAFCMSGPNGAEAYKSFQRSSQRRLQAGDLVLIHCNSTVGGLWTDITRTYCLGQPTDRQRRIYDAVLEARQAALAAIKPSARAADIDAAARSVMESHGFGKQFKHPTGHGVGYSAIDHNALPRLHPCSGEVLETGMAFNIEPAAYFPDECGLRHCEMAAVTASGADLLTPFHNSLNELILDV